MANFGKAFDEAFKPANAAGAAGAYDIIKQKIVEDQKTAKDVMDATTINHAAIATAIQTGNKDLVKQTATMIDAVGAKNPDASKLVFASIQDRVKAMQTQADQQASYALRSGALQPTQPDQMNDWNKSQVQSNIVDEMKAMDPGTTANSPAPVELNGKPFSPVPGFQTPAQTKESIARKDAKDIGDAMITGDQPFDFAGLYGKGAGVKAYLAKKGVDVEKGQLDWIATKKFAQSLNAPQQLRLNQSLDTVRGDIPQMKLISSELERSGFVPTNKIDLAMKLNGLSIKDTKGMSKSQVEVATKYVTQLNLMRDSLAQGFSGGYAPTEEGFKLADEILNPAYGAKQLGAALDQIDVNLNIRKNAVNNSQPVLVTGGNNKSEEVQMPNRSQAPAGAKGWNKKTGEWVF